jgi:uncharacterized protein (TIGR02145 family)
MKVIARKIATQFLLPFYLILFTYGVVCAQNIPQKFSYQAVIRDVSNQVLSNHAVGIRLSLLQGGESGTAVYVETQTGNTNAYGLISLQVGGGTVVNGSMSSIDWSAGPYFIKTETDPEGGTNYSISGSSQLLTVPYAQFSVKSANGISSGTNPNQILYWNGSVWATLNPGSNGQTLTLCKGVLTWTYNGVCPLDSVMDIDGNRYAIVTIGSQVWMKENLKLSKYRNGDVIAADLADSAWQSTNSGACVTYNYNSDYNTIFGKLYNWYAVSDSRGICPAGWHVPTDEEWYTLENFLDFTISDPTALGERGLQVGGRLKAVSELWAGPTGVITNSSGFSGLPGGIRLYEGGFLLNGQIGAWWTITDSSSTEAFNRSLWYSNVGSGRGSESKKSGFSVRCIQD